MHYQTMMTFFLGYNVDKSSKILIKTSSAMKYIESNIQNRKAPRINNSIIYYV